MKHKDFNKAIKLDDKDEIINLLLLFVENDDDWEWVQDKCLELINHDDLDIKGLAISCIGHIARIHGKINYEKVSKVLNNNISNLEIKGRIEDAFDDIEIFVKNKL